MKSIMQTAAFGIVAMIMSFGTVAPTWACTPLIVFVKGYGDSEETVKSMTRLYREESPRWHARGAKTTLLEWGDWWGSNEEKVEYAVKMHKRRYGRGAPAVLVGYSYGGDTAYLAADGLWDDDIEGGIRVMLVTLDPVGDRAEWTCSDFLGIDLCFGGMEVRDDSLKNPNGGPWIHVYSKSDTNSGCDRAARSGGHYKNQTRATQSIYLPVGHCAVRAMYSKAKPYIENYIERECR